MRKIFNKFVALLSLTSLVPTMAAGSIPINAMAEEIGIESPEQLETGSEEQTQVENSAQSGTDESAGGETLDEAVEGEATEGSSEEAASTEASSEEAESTEEDASADTASTEEDASTDAASSEEDASADTASTEEDASADTASTEKDASADTASTEEDASADTASTEEDVSADTASSEEDASAETASTEEDASADTASTEEGVSTDTTSTEDASTGESTVEEATLAETTTDEVVTYDPLEVSETVGDYTISVSASEGIFPTGTTVKIAKVDEIAGAAVEDIIKNVADFEGNVVKIVSFDISFWNGETEIEPTNGNVKVNFTLASDFKEKASDAADKAIENQQNMTEESRQKIKASNGVIVEDTSDVIKVFHIDDNAAVEAIDSSFQGDSVSIEADSFSVYSILVVEPVIKAAAWESADFSAYENAESITIDSATLNAIYGEATQRAAFRLLRAALGDKEYGLGTNVLTNVKTIKIGDEFVASGLTTDGTSGLSAFGIFSNKTLDLNGATIKYGVDGTENLFRSGDSSATSASGQYTYSNITIKNGTVDGNGHVKGLTRFARVDGLTVENVTFKGFKQHALEIAAVKNCTITNCKFESPDYSGESLTGGHEALAFDMTSNDSDFNGYGPADYLPVSNVTITGCSFSDMYRGLGSHHYKDNVFNTNINVSGCTFNNITDTAVMGVGWKNSTITKCTFNSVNMGVDFKQPAKQVVGSSFSEYSDAGCTVSDCDFTIVDKGDKIADAIRLGGFDNTSSADNRNSSLADKIYYVGGYTITGNKIHGSPDDGITFQFATNSTASGNVIDSSTGNGIQFVYAENCTVADNTVGSCKENNIYIKGGSDNTVSGNTVSDAKKNAIHMNYAAENITVTGNTVNSPSKNGIAAIDKCKGIIINDNKVNNVGNYGIHVSVKGTVVKEMYSNVITKAKKYGIMVSQKAVVKKTKDNSFVSQKKKKRISVSSGAKALFIYQGPMTLTKGKSAKITLYGTTSGAKVSTNKKTVATATKSKVSAKGNGKAVITIKSGKYKAQLTVNVNG